MSNLSIITDKGYKEEQNLVMLDSTDESDKSNEQEENPAGDDARHNTDAGDDSHSLPVCSHCDENESNELKVNDKNTME